MLPAMAPPALQHLCSLAIAHSIEQQEDESFWSHIVLLPPNLLSDILQRLSPLALLATQRRWKTISAKNEKSILKRKYLSYAAEPTRVHGGIFEAIFSPIWKELFYLRWPSDLSSILLPSLFLSKDYGGYIRSASIETDINWDQLYWQAHLQECLNEVSMVVSSLGLKDCMGDLTIPDKLLKKVSSRSYEVFKSKHVSEHSMTSLKYACSEFSEYLRCLRLQSFLCSSELANLLKKSNLQWIRFYNIRMTTDLTGIFQLLSQNKSTLEGAEFFNCILSESTLNGLCKSIYNPDQNIHQLQHWALVSTRVHSQSDLLSHFDFLRNGRSLCSIALIGVRLQPKSAASIANVVFESSIPLSVLCLNDNELGLTFAIETARMFQAKLSMTLQESCPSELQVLDLRSNSLDATAIKHLARYFECLPCLKQLNLSHNPIEDDGIVALLPSLKQSSIGMSSLVELRLGACNLSVVGATLLLEALTTIDHPLSFLSIADNHLGRTFSTSLAKFLKQSSILDLDVEEIGLDSFGSSCELEDALLCNKTLVNLNISKNRIGSSGASLLSTIISRQQGALTKINASYNMISFESMCALQKALQLNHELQHPERIQCLDLRGNPGCLNPQAAQLFEKFTTPQGENVVLLSNDQLHNLHDDDP